MGLNGSGKLQEARNRGWIIKVLLFPLAGTNKDGVRPGSERYGKPEVQSPGLSIPLLKTPTLRPLYGVCRYILEFKGFLFLKSFHVPGVAQTT